MKDRIAFAIGVAAVVFVAWAVLGVFGVAYGQTDDCTRSFRAVCGCLTR